MTTLTESQFKAVKAVAAWYKQAITGKGNLVFRLFGWAGTGKSTLLPFIVAECGIDPQKVRYGAWTGQAAKVMRNKGCDNASTIHSMLYNAVEREQADGTFSIDFRFQPEEHPLSEAPLIILDECSMVDAEAGSNLFSLDVPILVIGDSFQLPPVQGQGYFDGEPDVLLTEIHRQALDNPILRASIAIREHGEVRLGKYADNERLFAVPERQLDMDIVTPEKQLLCGTHKTRKAWNYWFAEKNKIDARFPLQEDAKFVVTRNDHNLGLMNGSVVSSEVTGVLGDPDEIKKELKEISSNPVNKNLAASARALLELDMKTLANRKFATRFKTDENKSVAADASLWVFHEEESSMPQLDYHLCRCLGLVQIDFGYCLTVHKAQGSEYNDVILLDDWRVRDSRLRWLYTAVTRAAERLWVLS